VHGDVDALRSCLRLSSIIDDKDQWIGGDTHFVQVGDILDQGDEEKDCLDLLLALKPQAKAAGGELHILLGNHEIMNADLDFRYVTPGAWDMWGDANTSGTMMVRLRDRLLNMGYPEYMKSRINAFKPGGFVAKQMSEMKVAIQIGDTVLVHGGLRLKHVKYGIEALNGETKRWLLNPGAPKPDMIDEPDSPVWARLYSTPAPAEKSVAELEEVLSSLDAKRMIVGHTPQLRGINCAYTEQGKEVWRCDTGMSKGMMKGPLECIEVLKDGTVHILTKQGVVPGQMRDPEVLGEVVDVCDIDSGICTPALDESENLMLAEQGDGQQEIYKPIDMLDIQEEKSEARSEVEKIRPMDDPSLPPRERLTKLVEIVVRDAVEREDKSLTKQTIRDILGKVVGRDMVAEEKEFIYAQVDDVVARYVVELTQKSR